MRAMESDQKHDRLRLARNLLYCGLPLFVYTITVIPLAISSRDRINPDAVAYIRRALYISRGDFYHSLSGYWSPLISWCIAPLIKLHMDPLHAARLITCLWGAIWLIAAAIFFDRFTSIHRFWKICALLISAIFIAEIAARQITPDVMLAACLLIYFSITLSPHFLRRPSLQFFAGLLGGFSYLAKAYALPFVLIHLPLTIFLRSWLDRDPENIRPPILLPLARALVGVAVFSLPWVAANSWRFGRLTISTAGAHAHSDVGPPEVQANFPSFFGSVPDPYITRHEMKDEMDYPTWSPFHSRKYFLHQLHIVVQHSLALGRSIFLFDRFYLTTFAALISILAIFGFMPVDFPKWKLVWLLLSAALYCSGMLLVFFTARYILPLWAPLLLALTLTVALKVASPPFLRSVFLLAILLSFSIAAISNLRNAEGKPPAYRGLAQALHEHHIHGSLASADRHQGLFVSFFADEKFLGFPSDEDANIAEQKLLAEKPAAVLIFKSKKVPKDMQQASRVAAQISKSPRWQLSFDFHVLDKQIVEIYIPNPSR